MGAVASLEAAINSPTANVASGIRVSLGHYAATGLLADGHIAPSRHIEPKPFAQLKSQ